MDGKFVKWDDANVHILTHTLHYGTGVFEGIRCYETDKGSAVFRHKEHIERLFRSAHILGYEIPYTQDKVMEAVRELIKKNKLKECYIRPIAYLGTEGRGLNPIGLSVHLSIAVWPWGTYLGKEALKNGIRAGVSSFTRHHPNISMTKSKATGMYLNSVLAKQEAIRNGFDEAIMLDPSGFVAEGSGENIFIVRSGKLKTPPLTSILDGITRDCIFTIAEDNSIPVTEQYFSRDELYMADEVFLTGTAAELTPICEVDRRKVGNGSIGPVTKKLQDIYFEAIRGRNEKYIGWLDVLK
jgi:branched-chain amino acid aminotransferase